MPIKRCSISRPSPVAITKLYYAQLNKSNVSASIWPQKNANPSFDTPPIVDALSSFIRYPRQFAQIFGKFFLSGLHQDSFIAGHFIKHIAYSLSPRVAVSLFSLLPNPDAFISNIIIKSFISVSQFDNALNFYRDFVANSSVAPNNFTFPLLSKLFSNLGLAQNGSLMHAQIVKLGFERDLFVRNGIIHMYCCFGELGSAWRLFEDFVEGSDLITWNSMIDGCVKNGMVEAARELFDEMPEKDLVSWNVMIVGYAHAGDMEKAKELFSTMPKRDFVTWNSMIDGYAKNADAAAARELFNSMPKKSLGSWNAVLAMYVRTKDYRECLNLFDSMLAVSKVKPSAAMFVSVLMACTKLGDLERGKWVHSLIKRTKRSLDVLLLTTLLTMYAKCGAMDDAKEVFDEMDEKNIVTWNSMIMGYGVHGLHETAIELFFELERSGTRPNDNTFVCIFSACVHGGLVVEGWWFFERMVKVYNIEPKVKHVGCMVDLLGRAGFLKDSEEIVKTMKGEPSKALWGALMSASRAHCDWSLGEVIGKRMVKMEPQDVGPYVMLSNIYAAEGRWDEVEKVRERMKEMGVKKRVGVSLVGGREFEFDFLEGAENSNGRKSMVYAMLSEMGSHLKLSQRQICIS